VLLLLFGVGSVYYSAYVIQETHVLDADVYISGSGQFGFNLDKDLVHFGIVPTGSVSSIRFMNVSNSHSFPVEVTLSATGDLGTWLFSYLEFDKAVLGPTFYLEPNELKSIAFGIIPGNDAVPGEQYVGKIKAVVKRASLWPWDQ